MKYVRKLTNASFMMSIHRNMINLYGIHVNDEYTDSFLDHFPECMWGVPSVSMPVNLNNKSNIDYDIT